MGVRQYAREQRTAGRFDLPDPESRAAEVLTPLGQVMAVDIELRNIAHRRLVARPRIGAGARRRRRTRVGARERPKQAKATKLITAVETKRRPASWEAIRT
jgi:hypothetical protein